MTNLKKNFEKALGSTLVVNGGVVGAVMTGALMGNYPIGLGAIICAASVATSFGAALATAISCEKEFGESKLNEPGL